MSTQRPDLDQLRSVLDALIEQSSQRGFLRPKQDRVRLMMILAGLDLEVVDTAKAALILIDQGLGAAAEPLVRKCFEFAVVAQWLQLTGDTNAYFHESEHMWRKVDWWAERDGIALPQEFVRRAGETVQSGGELRRFSDVCGVFSYPLYFLYAMLSESSHPRMGASLRWLRQHDNEIGLRFDHPDPHPLGLSLWPLGASLVWSASALDLTLVGQPRKHELEQAAQALALPHVLTPKE